MEKSSWADHVRNKELLLRVKEQRNILHELSKRKANWVGHILCRNCLLQQVTEGKIKGGIEVTGRRGKRLRKLLDDLKPLTPELNPSAQRCLTRFFTGDFASLTVHFVNICVKKPTNAKIIHSVY
jgi:hypothetical protein